MPLKNLYIGVSNNFKNIQDDKYSYNKNGILKSYSPIAYESSSRRSRPTFDTRQIDELESSFRSNKYVYGTDRARLAKRLFMTEKQVKIWFQNRRSKLRKISIGAESK
ncbi:hypothetical protein MXB_1688 [Myxobolus squamalis]|nr:hypothetical protein MXB_1688 [Myxobolus squamalis]